MQSSTSVPSSYDELPYLSYPFPHSHPERLATVAALFGMQPPPVEKCRVLELGCASGGNLIPMAESLPGSHFLGIDLSRRQVADARATIDKLALANIEIEAGSILDIDASFGLFDYIVCHGVFSWVPPPVQDKILEICAANLAPSGVAYVSYNTYPGWHMRGMIRDMMLYHTRGIREPLARVHASRKLLNFLADSTRSQDDAYGILLKAELNMLRDKADAYLFHDHLEEVNAPVYFFEFYARATARGLQYLGEASLGSMLHTTFDAPTQQTLRDLAPTTPEMEQYLDFLRNRTFRQTLLCHQGQPLRRQLTHDKVIGMHVSSPLRPDPECTDPSTRDTVAFKSPQHTISTDDPLTKSAMLCLGDAWPQSMGFVDLVRAARSRLRGELPGGEVAGGDERFEADCQRLGGVLINMFASRGVTLNVRATDCVLGISDRPKAGALARLQAQSQSQVTNRRHEVVALTELGRVILPLLDGSNDRTALLAALVDLHRSGKLELKVNGEPVQVSSESTKLLTQALDETLRKLARMALLIG